MKRILLCIVLCATIFNSCNHPTDASDYEDFPILGMKEFTAYQYPSKGSQYSVSFSANLVKVTENLEIYLRENMSMSVSDVNFIADSFEKIYPTLIDTYGTHTDVDDNGKIIVLLYDINEDVHSEYGYVAGFFNPSDLSKNNGTNNSNEAEILYVESQVQGDIENIFSTVIHEFQHLINKGMEITKELSPADLWLNEALSESTEILYLDEITVGTPYMSGNRWYTYNDTDGSYHDIIMKGNYFYTWNYYDNSVLADYATVSLFMYWIYLNNDGKNTIQAIAKGDNRGTYETVLDALHASSWEEVMFDWLKANENESSGYPNGKYAYWHKGKLYEGDLTLLSKVYEGWGESVNLFPGDAVLTKTQTTETNVNLRKASISTEHITLNINKDIFSPKEDHNGNLNVEGSISVTLPNTPITSSALIQSKVKLPDMNYRIRPISQATNVIVNGAISK